MNRSSLPDPAATPRPSTRSLPARIVAASFIVLILVGNCWFVLRVIGQEIPAWLSAASRVATAGVVGGGLLLLGAIVWRRFRRRRAPTTPGRDCP